MPWWAYTYLAIFILLTIGGVFDDLVKQHKFIYVSGGVVSAVFVCLFVLAFFKRDIGIALGLYVFPMLAIGISYELISAKRDMEEDLNDIEISDKELSYINNMVLKLGNLIIVPGYVFGFIVGLLNIGL